MDSLHTIPDRLWSIAEDDGDYTVEPSKKPRPEPEPVFGPRLRLVAELQDGMALDKQRRAARTTARDAPRDTEHEQEPAEAAGLSQRLHLLARAGDCDLAEQLSLLLQFDALEGWRAVGCSSCISWMNEYLRIGRSTAYDRLAVARALESLPMLRALFRVGKLSWSQILELCSVADAENEERLALAALHLSASATRRLCRDFRHARSPDGTSDDDLARQAFEKRSLTWRSLDEHSIEFRLRLPTDQAAELIAVIDLFEQTLMQGSDAVDVAAAAVDVNPATTTPDGPESGRPDESSGTDGVADAPGVFATVPKITARQRRADTLQLISMRAITTREQAASADLRRVNLSIQVGAAAAAAASGDTPSAQADGEAPPPRRPLLSTLGPVSPATARRIACDAGLSVTSVDDTGEPLDIGRRSRVWPTRLRRAILERDGHCCQVPGCGARHGLDVHHILHWVDGGDTSVANGVTACRRCHVLLHEGGFRIERTTREGVRADLLARHGQHPPPDTELAAAVRLVLAVQRFRLVSPSYAASRSTERRRST